MRKNLLAARYPWIRFSRSSTRPAWAAARAWVPWMRTVSDLRTSPTTSRPAARMVVPVSTRSTTASANPREQATSTDPVTFLIAVLPAREGSSLSKKSLVSPGKLVTTLLPTKSAGAAIAPSVTGACTHSLHCPNPSRITSTTAPSATPFAFASSKQSNPVMPMSTFPSPTYRGMSAQGRNTRVTLRSFTSATSRRSGRT
mmetsp:Transcript_21469/g.47133  ORF Transcript_21469/g.47133 Transcript_21469/m.47133 type:complete len:200 (-) Transcript_21469:192-791(-)